MQRTLNRIAASLAITILAQTSPARSAENENNFVSLFDGKSLDGWVIMNDAKFVVEDGVIKLSGGRGWLRSDKEYSNFVLRLEVRWLKPKQDSGIFLRATKEGKNWPNRRYEVQCENSARVARIFGASHKRDIPLATKTLKGELGEWNSYEVTCNGEKCEVKLNDVLVTTSDAFKIPTGHIGFQGEGGLLEFRKVRIKELP